MNFMRNVYRRISGINETTVINDRNIRQIIGIYFRNRTELPLHLQNISTWNTSNVTNMSNLFENVPNFNENINNWDVSNVTNMLKIFAGCTTFNQPLNNWNVSNVTTLQQAFENCVNFNQPLDNWNVSNVRYGFRMFNHCTSFNQNLSSWSFDNLIIDNVIRELNNPTQQRQMLTIELRNILTSPVYERLIRINGLPQIQLDGVPQIPQPRQNNTFIHQSIQNNIFEQSQPQTNTTSTITLSVEDEANQHFTPVDYQITQTTQGRAFEVHNIFSTLSGKKLQYLYDFTKNEVNVSPLTYTQANINDHIETKFLEFINSEENIDLNRNVYIEAMTIIKHRLNIPSNLTQLYGYVIDFIFQQPYILKMNYVQSCFKDCIRGYSNNDLPLSLPFSTASISCSKGITEKIILSLGSALKIVCTINDETNCPQNYKDLYKNVFSFLNMTELVQEWTQNFLDNDEFKTRHNIRENDEESKRKMRQSLENFLKKKYFEAGEYTEENLNKINREIEQYDELGVFSNLYFGGFWNKKRNMKRRTKRMIQRKTKRMIKTRRIKRMKRTKRTKKTKRMTKTRRTRTKK